MADPGRAQLMRHLRATRRAAGQCPTCGQALPTGQTQCVRCVRLRQSRDVRIPLFVLRELQQLAGPRSIQSTVVTALIDYLHLATGTSLDRRCPRRWESTA